MRPLPRPIDRYPFEPPSVLFRPPVPYHPNIDGGGRICLDMLKMPPSGAWRPTVPLLALLHAIRLLLAEPNPNDPLLPDIVSLHQSCSMASCHLIPFRQASICMIGPSLWPRLRRLGRVP